MKLKFRKVAVFSLAACCLVIFFSCNRINKNTAGNDFLDTSGIDSTIRPQDDFFHYANGGWIKKTEIPASESGWGAFNILHQNTMLELRSLLDSSARLNAAKGSITQKVGDFYAAAMDSTAVEQKGITPLQPDLQRIAGIQTAKDILHEVAVEYNATGRNFNNNLCYLFWLYAAPDEKNSNKMFAHFDQDGLGLPTRDYYTKQDSSTINIRKAYLNYISEILQLTGDDASTAAKSATSVMAIESALAKASKSPVELRDPEANYHKFTLEELNRETPNINWNELMSSLSINQDSILVGQPAYFKQLSKLFQSIPIADWKNYLRFHLVDNYANYLSSSFVNAKFTFNKLLSGRKELQPRWKRMVAFTDDQLGDALGELFVQRYFPPEAKKRILDLVNNIQLAYRERIQNLTWMSDTTKQKALVKLDAIVKKIGYPDKWKDYSSVEISKDNLIQNYKNTGHFAYQYMIHQIGKPVDRSEWYMTPPTINAYYNPQANDINFPAGILQPPFFYKDGDDAINYGAIGLVIGHEITHGFDDQGRQFDAQGNLKSWWLPEDSVNFRRRADLVVNQYNHSLVVDTLHINGELTQGENIADIGGLAIAYDAFKKTAEGKSDKKIDGLTPDQRFFMSYAGIWRSKMRPEIERTRVMTDPHSTPKYRVNNPLSDLPAFYKTFDVRPGDKMYVPDSLRAQVW